MRRLVAGLSFFVACSPEPAPPCPTGVTVALVAPDFSASQVGVLPLDGTAGVFRSSPELGGDPALVSSAGRFFFVARDRDAIFETDACGLGIASFTARTAGETNVNPQDVAVASNGALWVPRLLSPSLLVIGTPPTTIDLSAFDSDGNPDMSSVRIVGNRAFVALERLNPYPTSVLPSQVAVLDTTSLSLVKTITLVGRNPFGLMTESNGLLWLAEPGNFADASEPAAGIESIDSTAMTSTLVFAETSLGGSVAQVAVSGACGAAIIADATPNVNRTSLISFAVDGSFVSPPALGPTDGFDLQGLIWASGELLVGDRRPTAAGYPVHVFLAASTSCALSAMADLSVQKMPVLAFAH